ncbi:MAG: hypothetical protein AAGI34_03640, partial [Pseudomonadota bacterium]
VGVLHVHVVEAMPFKIDVPLQGSCLLVRWTGRFDGREIRDYYAYLEQSGLVHTSTATLHDARSWDMSVDMAEVLAASRLSSPAISPGRVRRVGVVVAGLAAYGKMRAFCTLRELEGRRSLDVFRDWEAARAFVAVREPAFS